MRRARRRPAAARPHGHRPADLLATPRPRATVPTFAQYVPRVRDAVGDGTRRVYGSYLNRVVDRWPDRRLDDITPTGIKQLVEHTRTHVVARRNNRGGRSAAEHRIAALRCLYRHAEDDGEVCVPRHRRHACHPSYPQSLVPQSTTGPAPSTIRSDAATMLPTIACQRIRPRQRTTP